MNKIDFAHWFRRAFHVSMVAIPLWYYWVTCDEQIPALTFTILFSIVFLFFFEGIRLRKRWLFWAQRSYERTQISALSWALLSIGIVLLLAPHFGYCGGAYGLPLIATMALVDPILGELRRRSVGKFVLFLVGLIIAGSIWASGVYFLGTPPSIAVIVTPICVWAEMVNIRNVDDNATMLLVPLAVVLVLHNALFYTA